MRVRSLIIPVVAATALLAGCSGTPTPNAPTTNGVDALSADAIVDKAEQALLDAGSFHVAGKGESDGDPIEVDMVFDGDDKQGSMTVTGMSFELLVVGGDSYFKGGEDLWAQFAEAEQLELLLPLVEGKWVLIPGGGGIDLEPTDVLDPSGTVTKGEVTTLAGKPVIILEDEDGAKLYVSLEGEPYPLQIVHSEGTITFTEFGKDFGIEAPADDEVFDLATFFTTG